MRWFNWLSAFAILSAVPSGVLAQPTSDVLYESEWMCCVGGLSLPLCSQDYPPGSTPASHSGSWSDSYSHTDPAGGLNSQGIRTFSANMAVNDIQAVFTANSRADLTIRTGLIGFVQHAGGTTCRVRAYLRRPPGSPFTVVETRSGSASIAASTGAATGTTLTCYGIVMGGVQAPRSLSSGPTTSMGTTGAPHPTNPEYSLAAEREYSWFVYSNYPGGNLNFTAQVQADFTAELVVVPRECRVIQFNVPIGESDWTCPRELSTESVDKTGKRFEVYAQFSPLGLCPCCEYRQYVRNGRPYPDGVWDWVKANVDLLQKQNNYQGRSRWGADWVEDGSRRSTRYGHRVSREFRGPGPCNPGNGYPRNQYIPDESGCVYQASDAPNLAFPGYYHADFRGVIYDTCVLDGVPDPGEYDSNDNLIDIGTIKEVREWTVDFHVNVPGQPPGPGRGAPNSVAHPTPPPFTTDLGSPGGHAGITAAYRIGPRSIALLADVFDANENPISPSLVGTLAAGDLPRVSVQGLGQQLEYDETSTQVFAVFDSSNFQGTTLAVSLPLGNETATSSMVWVDIPSLCLADIDYDGGVTIDDLLAFLEAYSAGTLQADFSFDGGVTIDDLLEFLERYELGC